ncbi:hypothetical protein [Clostridium sp. HBUAS56010]|uniref:glycan biosynthesis hexose transferase WsfD n=1 Tax=Clostridium sp. HBUAS56010 TaxID=2571127 RepID=UPI0011778FB1|nr:hypothetical protein [Clostridium sp. HBUAS56010]
MKNREKLKTAGLFGRLFKLPGAIRAFIRRVNLRMEGKYSPFLLATAVTAVTGLLACIILFSPNYLGVALDGSTDEAMHAAGIYYIQKEPEERYNNYFIKTYSTVPSGEDLPGRIRNSQEAVIRLARAVDDLFTRDNYFDIRFLGGIYLLCYLPAVFLVVWQVCQRVKRFSEGLLIAAAGLFIFSDVGYITYFNSFYPEAVWLVAMLYCVGASMTFQKKRSLSKDLLSLLLFLSFAGILTVSRWQCAVLGFLFAFYAIRLIFVRNNFLWGTACLGTAFILSSLAVLCLFLVPDDFSETSRFHAMTRGVLFGSSNPEKTLHEFGIDPSYELLTDASAYDYLPFVKAGDQSLYHGFMDQFTTSDIGFYYLRHPASLVQMIDVSIGAGMEIRRSTCGNYERSAGLPPKAKSIFWSGWSTFKMTSAPRTIGYVLILIIAIFFLFYKGYSIRPREDWRNTVFLDMLILVFGVFISQSVVVIIGSGDVEMVQRMFLGGLSLDVMTYCVFAQLQHKIKIV